MVKLYTVISLLCVTTFIGSEAVMSDNFKSPRKPYCGIVALSSITGKPTSDLEYHVNMNRRRPKDSKIVGMQVKEVMTALTDHGYSYELEDLKTPVPLNKWKNPEGTRLIVLDSYKGDPPHMIASNGEFFVDSDNRTKTHKSVYRYPDRPIRAIIVPKKEDKLVSDFFDESSFRENSK